MSVLFNRPDNGEADDFKGPVLIWIEPRPDVPWHRAYHINRIISEESHYYDISEIDNTTPEIIKRISDVDGIARIGIELTCVRISLRQNLDWEKAWPAIEKRIISMLMQFAREKDSEVECLERLVH
ncbi:MAG: hypothetical protein Q7S09_04310 [bacterium]|nr:hypothetical protein [bacterium]